MPRSVDLRIEIGRNPHRDRSQPAPRSVATRTEIGRSPHRDRSGSAGLLCVDGSEVRGMQLSLSSSSCAPRRRVGRAEPDRSQCGAWWVIPGGRRLFSVLHTGATRTPAEPPHGHPTHLTRPPTPKTTPPETTTPHTRTRPRCPHTPQPQHKTEPISTRSTTDLKPEPDRSRRGVRPISTRVATDLEPEPDRSRRGLARGAGCGRAPASISSEASREPVRRRPRRSSGRAGRCPYAAPPCGRPRRSHR